jgi:membrane glycosyltransferase
MSYLASPLWMGQLLVGLILVVQSAYIRPEYFSNEFRLFPAWPRFDAERALFLFEVTMAVLLAPKLFGLITALSDERTRDACGGAVRLIASSLIEVLMSALFAPVMMVIQTGSVMQIIFGRDTGWNPQRRDDGSIPLADIIRRHWLHTAFGVLTLIAGLMISPSLVAWMSPTIAGLILAIALSWASGQLSIGLWLKKHGLLLTPEEYEPPAIAQRANVLMDELAQSGADDENSLLALYSNPTLRAAHIAFLPPAPPRQRGHIDADHAVAEAKLVDAECLDDALTWLKAKERMVVLHDRALLTLLADLPLTRSISAL